MVEAVHRPYYPRYHLPLLLCLSLGCCPAGAGAGAAVAGSAAARAAHGNLIYDAIPEAPDDGAAVLHGYLAARQATPLGWSPHGELLVSTRFGEVQQLHLVARPGGERRQLTFLEEPVSEAAFAPDPQAPGFCFLVDAAGRERGQLFYQRLGAPTATRLTDGKAAYGAAVWSNDGHSIAFYSTARDGASFDIDVVEPASDALPHLVVTGDKAGTWFPLDWSPDDRKLLVLKHVSSSEDYLYVVDLGTGQKREVEPVAPPGKVAIAGAKFSRDGQGVYLLSDRDADFKRLRYVNLFTAEKTVLSGHIAWDVEELAISRDGHYLAYVVNEAGASRLEVMDLKSHQDLGIPHLPAAGQIGHLNFDADNQRLAFGFDNATLQRDAYVLDLANHRLEAWTHSEPGAVDPGTFVTPRLARYPTFDRANGQIREEPAYVYEPSSPGPHPVLVLLHGGPAAQFRPHFDPWIQYAVNELGYAVVAPNIRGSSGYGKEYMALDDGRLRDDVVKDLGALIVWADLQSEFDAKHVVVAGGGYGGFLALAALDTYGDRLQGAVDVAGISDLVGFLEKAPAASQAAWRAEFGDERDSDMRAYLRHLSPLTNAERITKPLLVVHGSNDPRVPLGEAEKIVNRLRSRGGEVWYLSATDEGHDFRRQSNREAYYETFAQFLKRLR